MEKIGTSCLSLGQWDCSASHFANLLLPPLAFTRDHLLALNILSRSNLLFVPLSPSWCWLITCGKDRENRFLPPTSYVHCYGYSSRNTNYIERKFEQIGQERADDYNMGIIFNSVILKKAYPSKQSRLSPFIPILHLSLCIVPTERPWLNGRALI
jgi:hypothetical protein